MTTDLAEVAYRCLALFGHDITILVPRSAQDSPSPEGTIATQKASAISIMSITTNTQFRNNKIKLVGLALSLFVFRVLTDNHDTALSLNDFALFANWLY